MWRGGYYNITFARVLMDVFAIVNPLSGAGANPDAAAIRVALLTQRFAAAGIAGSIHLTEHRGHAAELASAAIAQGARAVLAWGGDGTINEIGSIVAGTSASLGIVPAGSGNGFAAELGVPWQPAEAIDVAIGIRETFRYRAATYRVTLDGEEIVSNALVIAFANGREYGNRIRVAPQALVDDGKLEAVVVEDRTPLSRLWMGRHLALGTANRAARVLLRSIESARVETDGDILYHLDGEVGRAQGAVTVRIRPRLLKVRVP
jgi:diacylglycerol kinase (ATP)